MTRLSCRVMLLDVVLVVDPEIEPDGLVLAVLSEPAFITGAETKAGTDRGIDSGADEAEAVPDPPAWPYRQR